MEQLTTSVDIDAPADIVWEVLTDFSSYPEWNGMTRIDGEPRVGETLTVRPGPDAGRLPTFRPVVLRADGDELRWRGKLFVEGLFDGEHRFTVEERGGDRSRLVQAEQFSGLLVGPITRLLGDDTRRNFEAVNAALKARAESLAAADTPDARA